MTIACGTLESFVNSKEVKETSSSSVLLSFALACGNCILDDTDTEVRCLCKDRSLDLVTMMVAKMC
jgi:hypothetical protein